MIKRVLEIIGAAVVFIKVSGIIASLSSGPISAIMSIILFWGIVACLIGSIKAYHIVK